jgi:hypothetical protein
MGHNKCASADRRRERPSGLRCKSVFLPCILSMRPPGLLACSEFKGEIPNEIGVPSKFCASGDETHWYGRSMEATACGGTFARPRDSTRAAF